MERADAAASGPTCAWERRDVVAAERALDRRGVGPQPRRGRDAALGGRVDRGGIGRDLAPRAPSTRRCTTGAGAGWPARTAPVPW